MEKTDEKLASLIERLQEVGFAQAPEIIDGTIRAIHWDGVLQLGFMGSCFVLLLSCIILSAYAIIKDKDALGPVTVFGTIVLLFVTGIAASKDNPWLKVFDPEASLYQRIVEAIL